MHIENGWIIEAERCPSPNYNDRPGGIDIDLLVIHNISLPPAQFGGPYVRDFFLNRLDCLADPYFEKIASLKVSAHCFIDRDGMLTQFVSFNKRAWHAGRSSFGGRDECNDYSVGIELEGCDDVAYTDAQYACLAKVTRALLDAYPAINRERITGHSDIAPHRKTDPGPAFDWARYFKGLPE